MSENGDYEEDDIFDSSPEYDVNSINFDEKIYDIKNNITRNKLNKYEKAAVIIMRSEQINSGSIPFISNYKEFNSIEEIVKEEFNQNKIPFIIERTIMNKKDYWKLSDLN
jgi:DNA-directed RNA polymerase subunit K/omega